MPRTRLEQQVGFARVGVRGPEARERRLGAVEVPGREEHEDALDRGAAGVRLRRGRGRRGNGRRRRREGGRRPSRRPAGGVAAAAARAAARRSSSSIRASRSPYSGNLRISPASRERVEVLPRARLVAELHESRSAPVVRVVEVDVVAVRPEVLLGVAVAGRERLVHPLDDLRPLLAPGRLDAGLVRLHGRVGG